MTPTRAPPNSLELSNVPFRGNGPSSAALLGGQIDLIIDGLAPQLGNIADSASGSWG